MPKGRRKDKYVRVNLKDKCYTCRDKAILTMCVWPRGHQHLAFFPTCVIHAKPEGHETEDFVVLGVKPFAKKNRIAPGPEPGPANVEMAEALFKKLNRPPQA